MHIPYDAGFGVKAATRGAGMLDAMPYGAERLLIRCKSVTRDA